MDHAVVHHLVKEVSLYSRLICDIHASGELSRMRLPLRL